MLVNTPRAFLHLLNRDLFLATFIVNIFFISKIQRGFEKPCGSNYLPKFVFLEIIFDLKRKLDKNKSLLLNSCIFTIGKTTYVDFLPFFNPNSGSELSILRIIIHHKKFELLTHPLCELFLHLKLLRSRSLYWIVIILNFVFTFLTIIYVIWMYGNIGKANYTSDI